MLAFIGESGMNKAVFLDRDGTINVEKRYLHKIEDFEFLPGVIEALKLLQSAGYILIIVTNQSGIGRGYYTEADFNLLNDWMLNTLKQEQINVSKVYYCPHLPNAKIERYRVNCTCRKPSLGMYDQAIEDFNIDVSKSWAIGDKIRDCAICEKYGCRGYLISNNEKADVINKVKNHEIKNVSYAIDLLECAKYIIINPEV